MVINKFDLNREMTKKIEEYCKENDIEMIGKIAFDDSVVKAMIRGKTIMEYGNGKVKKDIIKIWEKIQKSL